MRDRQEIDKLGQPKFRRGSKLMVLGIPSENMALEILTAAVEDFKAPPPAKTEGEGNAKTRLIWLEERRQAKRFLFGAIHEDILLFWCENADINMDWLRDSVKEQCEHINLQYRKEELEIEEYERQEYIKSIKKEKEKQNEYRRIIRKNSSGNGRE